MHRSTKNALQGIAATLLSVGLGGAAAGADLKSHFNLPAEPLERALRDLALQAKCNISFEPSLVAGLQAPAIKGEYSRAEAVAMLLSGTSLKVVTVNDNTMQVLGALEKRDLDEIIVTGTHIRGVTSASPVIELGREEIDRSGYASIAELMLTVPQNFGGGINPGTTVNSAVVNTRYADNPTGASVPNLRGLGPGSTLTLIDGHRMASGLAGGGADISSIPVDAVERVEIVTDSASAIYGSDAVAGVVNIILNRNYDGAKTSLSYGYAPEGGGAQTRASQMFGTGWKSGNVMLAYEFMRQDAVDAKDRDFTATAARPYSLVPATKSNSLTLSARQDLTPAASVFIDGLYVARDANRYLTDPGVFVAPAAFPASLRRFAVAAGIDFNLWRDWKATLSVTDAKDRTDATTVMLTSPETLGFSENSIGTLRDIEGSANGIVGDLPAGPIRLALGLGYRRESFSNSLGGDSVATGSRDIRYAFGELSIPLVGPSARTGLSVLDLVVSGRSEHYSDFGSTTVPKMGLVYQPTGSLKLRSTWGKAFRAPNLFDTKSVPQLLMFDLPDPATATGTAPILFRAGGNPGLRPETADAWSVGADYSLTPDNRLQLSTTLFEINYKNRISQIGDPYSALMNPLDSFFITPSPSASYAQSVVDEYPPYAVYNATGAPFVPGNILAVVDARLVNVASQIVRGVDLNMDYRIDTTSSSTLIFVNGTYLDLTQRNTPQSPSQKLSGLAFYPSQFRARVGATWRPGSWALTGTVNYLAHETNTQVTPAEAVGSWTTIDASLRYSPRLTGLLGGLNVNLSALNILNRDPPYATTQIKGLNYDSSNMSAMGRLITLQVSKEW